jgi:hypothetical protein
MNIFDLDFSISKVEDTSLTNGERATIFYLRIFNNQLNGRNIHLAKAIYIDQNKEQLEQDIGLAGHLINSCNLKANAFREAGLVFYKSQLQNISDDDLLFIVIELKKEKKKLLIEFVRKNENWTMKKNEISDMEAKLTPRTIEVDLLKKIERLEVFEERFKMYFDKLSINVDEYFGFNLLFEAYPISGTTFENTFMINCILYDKENKILKKADNYIIADTFFGFEVFDFRFSDNGIAKRVEKIRLYPSK